MEQEDSWVFYGADFTLTDGIFPNTNIDMSDISKQFQDVESLFKNMTLNHVFFIKFNGLVNYVLQYSMLTLKYNNTTKQFDGFSLNYFDSDEYIYLVKYPTSFGIVFNFVNIENILSVADITNFKYNDNEYNDVDSWAIINGVNEGNSVSSMISRFLKENIKLTEDFKNKVKELITKRIEKIKKDRIESIINLAKNKNLDRLVANEIASFNHELTRKDQENIHTKIGGKRKNTKGRKRKFTKKIRRTRKRTY